MSNDVHTTLDDKLNIINNDFPLIDYSISRLLLPIMFPEKFKIYFSKEEALEIGNRVRFRISDNLNKTIIPRLEFILARTGGNYSNLIDSEKEIKSEFELLQTLSQLSYSKFNLSNKSKSEIKKKLKELKKHTIMDIQQIALNYIFIIKKSYINFQKLPSNM